MSENAYSLFVRGGALPSEGHPHAAAVRITLAS